jgi:hypothetical protein
MKMSRKGWIGRLEPLVLNNYLVDKSSGHGDQKQ